MLGKTGYRVKHHYLLKSVDSLPDGREPDLLFDFVFEDVELLQVGFLSGGAGGQVVVGRYGRKELGAGKTKSLFELSHVTLRHLRHLLTEFLLQEGSFGE